MQAQIDRLLHEAQRAKFTERRTEPRHPFVRPVRLKLANSIVTGFAKDVSKQGIGIIVAQEFETGSMALLSIHSTQHTPVTLKCEVRWCDRFGAGWFLTGWKFISPAPDFRS